MTDRNCGKLSAEASFSVETKMDGAVVNTIKGTSVNEFYKGKSIFVTGGSGFMGKVLIEKLLYSCSDLKEIFILMRPKKGRVPESRLEDMFKLPVSKQTQLITAVNFVTHRPLWVFFLNKFNNQFCCETVFSLYKQSKSVDRRKNIN